MMQITKPISFSLFASEAYKFIQEAVKESSHNVTDIKLRMKEASWEIAGLKESNRYFLDITYGNGPAARIITTDLQFTYEKYFNHELSELEAYTKAAKDVDINIASDKAEQIFRANKSTLEVPRDATVLPMCLDRGESLKAYHQKIGYKLPQGYSYGDNCLIKEDAAQKAKDMINKFVNVKSNETMNNAEPCAWDEAEEDRSY